MKFSAILRKTVLTLIPAAAFVMMARPAHADLLVEPYLGYAMGTFKGTVANVSGESDDTGVVLGGRLGVAFPLIWVAADASMITGKQDEDDLSATLLGITAGVKVPFIRGYLGYMLKSDFKYDDAKYSGTTIKVGGSFTGLPFVAINLEYLMTTFDKGELNGAEFDIGSGHTISKATENAVVLSVSAPFEF